MNIIKPSAHIIGHENLNAYQVIERVGRTCYKSENLITTDSAKTFVKGLITRKHYAMLEHEHIYIRMNHNTYFGFKVDDDFDLSFINMSYDKKGTYIMSGSFRAFRDLFLKAKKDYCCVLVLLYHSYPLIFEEVLKSIYGDNIPYTKEDIEQYEECQLLTRNGVKRVYKDRPDLISKHLVHSVHFICDRGVSHEFVRHRNCGFAQESTRYCNYSKDKFSNEITFIKPFFFVGKADKNRYRDWFTSANISETMYLDLIEKGVKPEEARSVLPQSVKTELVITATEEEWQHIINLRYLGTTGRPHPQMKEVMGIIVDSLAKESEGRLNYEADEENN